MDFYLQLLDEQVKMKDENPSIGIILCADKENIVVEYADGRQLLFPSPVIIIVAHHMPCAVLKNR